MEMNDILNGLNSCGEDDCCESSSSNCGCGPSFGGSGMGCFPGNFGQGFGNTCGCGFGSWIWILLILFYCGCGGGRNYGSMGNNCCCEKKCDCCCEKKHDCCCNSGRSGNYGGFLSNCSPYLFILVILFLCNNNFNGCSGFGQGIGGCGFGQGINPCNNNFGCVTSC